MRFPSVFRKTICCLTAILTLMSVTALPAYAAEEATMSDARWQNGRYTSSFEDMSARRLYVYGLIDSNREITDKSTDKDLSFSAEKPAGRLDAASLLFAIAGEETEKTNPFTDVPEEYAEAVDWLYVSGITKGISEDLYGTGNLSEYHFLIMLSRLLNWQTEDMSTLTKLAEKNRLLPYYDGRDGFSLGDMYQIVCKLLELRFPEKCTAVRPRMSTPGVFQIFPETFDDAEFQIKAAAAYLPDRIEVMFKPNSSKDEINAFRSYYDKQNANKTAPLTGLTEGMLYMPWSLEESNEKSFRLYIYSYSQSHIAYTSDSDWLRVYSDERYSDSLRDFREKYLNPLLGKTEYDKARDAHDLLCRLASYDYETADFKPGSGKPFRGEAHDILGFIDGRSVVCDGYANTYQWMLKCLGIESYMVIGRGDGAVHAWNKVKIDGRWYNADVCWDDTGSGLYRNFLKSDKWFLNHGHSFTDKFSTTAFPSTNNYN